MVEKRKILICDRERIAFGVKADLILKLGENYPLEFRVISSDLCDRIPNGHDLYLIHLNNLFDVEIIKKLRRSNPKSLIYLSSGEFSIRRFIQKKLEIFGLAGVVDDAGLGYSNFIEKYAEGVKK